MRLYGKSTLPHLEELGLAGPHVSLAHGVWLTPEDMAVCAESGMTVCHNPSSNLRLRVGVLPGVALAEHGVNIALGMDSTTLNDDEDMLQEMRLAQLLHRLPNGMRRTRCLTPVGRVSHGNGGREHAADDGGDRTDRRRAGLRTLSCWTGSGSPARISRATRR